MSALKQTAVINTNLGDVSDIAYVSQGYLYVPGDVANNVTNKGFAEPIAWPRITSFSKTAYAAGAQKVIEINFDSPIHGLVAGDKLEMTIRSPWKIDGKPYNQTFTVYAGAAVVSPATTIEQVVANQFYSVLNQAGYPFTVTQSTTTLVITSAFGTLGLNNEDFTIEMPWVAADAAPLTITGIADSGGTKCTITSNGHGKLNGDIVKITDVTWTVPPTAGDFDPNKGYVISEKATNTFKVVHVFTGATYDSGGTASEVAQGTTTEYVKPEGTKAIVNTFEPAYDITGGTYTTYKIEHEMPVRSDHGFFPHKEVHSQIFADTDEVAVGLILDAILAGKRLPVATISGITKADPGVCTTVRPHGLKVGDEITMNGCVVNPTDFNGKIFTVTVVGAVDTFEFGFDASGITSAETAGFVRLLNPEEDYLAK